MEQKIILNNDQIETTLKRLALEIIENHSDFSETAIIGLQPRGTMAARKIVEYIKQFTGLKEVLYGELDHTFHRDDFRRSETLLIPHPIKIEFNVEKKNIVLVDDVLYTGRSVRSAMDALTTFGRPAHIELMVLIDRRFNREIPIHPNYYGKVIDTRAKNDNVKVVWHDNKNEVWLLNAETK